MLGGIINVLCSKKRLGNSLEVSKEPAILAFVVVGSPKSVCPRAFADDSPSERPSHLPSPPSSPSSLPLITCKCHFLTLQISSVVASSESSGLYPFLYLAQMSFFGCHRAVGSSFPGLTEFVSNYSLEFVLV